MSNKKRFSIIEFLCGIYHRKPRRKGLIKFTTGNHEIFVKTHLSKNERVWIHIIKGCDPTCVNSQDVDLFNVEESHKGFIITASVKSNSRKVYWIIR
mgnify:CR=1 FL=1